MTQVSLLHILKTLTVALVSENDRQYMLKYRNWHIGPQFGGFTEGLVGHVGCDTGDFVFLPWE